MKVEQQIAQAQKLARAGKTREADAVFQSLLQGKSVKPLLLKAASLFYNRYARQPRRAVPLVAALVKGLPQSASAHALACETYSNCKRFPLAKRHADLAADLAPDDPDTLHICAYAHLHAGGFHRALALVDAALRVRPGHGPALLQKGRVLLGLGDLDGAEKIARALFGRTPDDINVLGLFADVAKPAADDPVLIHLRDSLLPQYRAVGGDHYAHLLKLVGKLHNDAGAFLEAFDYFAQAKAAAPLRYDAEGYTRFVDTMVNQTQKESFGPGGSYSTQPVLIVGMPRSGSTLLEQVLTMHPEISSAGESPSLITITQDVGIRPQVGTEMLRAIDTMPPDGAAKLAARYLTETDQENGAKRVIDKTMHNFEMLGFFAKLFPRAPIIHTVRDPMDTCVSCYMQLLSGWHRYTQDLESLGHAYVQYQRLMAHWKQVLPNPILDVSYEALVSDLEPTARQVIDFLDLAWDPACLAFQSSDNASFTLSARQVREPLNTKAVQRWRHYEPRLAPLKARLAPLYPTGLP